MFELAAVAVGVACLASSGLAWTGRWRRWAGRPDFWGRPAGAITLTPAVGAMLVLSGLWGLGVPVPVPIGAVVLLALVAGLVLYFWTPAWWGPRWYRARDRHAPPDRTDPSVLGWARRAEGRARPTVAVAAAVTPRWGPPLTRWRANWFPPWGQPWHHLFVRGREALGGRIAVYPQGLVFESGGLTRRWYNRPHVAVVPAEQVRRIGTRRSSLPGMSGNLLVETDDGDHEFFVVRPKHKAARLRGSLACHP